MSVFRSLMAASKSTLQPSSFGGYVTDGLIFMIDAIWNDVVDAPQNPNLGGIRDLISGDLIKFPISYKYGYHDNCLTILSGNKNVSHRVEFYTGLSLGDLKGMTVEQADMPLAWQFSDSYTPIQAPVINTAFAFASGRPSGSSIDHDAIRSYYTQPNGAPYSAVLFRQSSVNIKRHLSCALSPVIADAHFDVYPSNAQSLRINGIAVDQLSDISTYLASVTNAAPLMITIGSNSRMDMNLYSYRIYNRVLTPAEQAQNYAIDRIRFSL